MKATIYQNVLLIIIAGCLIVITLSMTGIIEYTHKGELVPVEIKSVYSDHKKQQYGDPILDVRIID
jgi:hypothetical protein